MNPKTATALAAASASVALFAGTGVASAAQIRGIVVDRNARSHTFVIADGQGRLREVHARLTPALGRSVTVVVNRLRNGTWGASRVRVGRTVHVARIRGTVTYVSAGKGVFVVSARGVSLLVHRRHVQVATRDLASFAGELGDGLPPVGTTVTVSTDLSGDQVDATEISDQGQTANGVDLEGFVLSIDTGARTLTISADDSEESVGSIIVQVPASFDMTAFQVGGRVELVASLNPDGTYTLEQSSRDGSATEANDGRDQQGDGNGDQHSSAAALCLAQENEPNFPATHNGESFLQFYSSDPTQLDPNDAFGRCVDAMHQAAESQGGSDGSSAGTDS